LPTHAKKPLTQGQEKVRHRCFKRRRITHL
jgi:hypothetical protein